MTLIGHEIISHRTNGGAIVPLCTCGWGGGVHPTPENARREWYAHCQGVDLERAVAVAAAVPIVADLAARMRHPETRD